MFRRRLHLLLIGATVLMASPHTAYALRIDYIIDFTAEHSNNLLLTPDDPVSLTVLRPGASFDIAHESSTLQTHISGRAEYRHYGDSRFDDTVDGALTGRVNWVAIPERLSFSVVDSLALQPVDTLAPDTPGNRQQVNVLAAGPTLSFDWGAGWRGATELRYVRSEAEVTDQFNSNRIDLALRAIKPISATSRLAFNAQTQRVDFEDDATARDYTRSALFARYSRTLNRFDLAIDLGYSRLDYRRSFPGLAGARSDPLLRAELGWRPNASHRLGLRFNSEFSDVAADSLANLGEGSELPTEIVTGEAVVNASPYLQRQLEADYAFTATRWTFGVTPYVGRRRYEDIGTFDQNDYGTSIEASWRARHNLRLGATASLIHIDYVNLDRQDETRRYGGHVRYDWAKHWSGTLSLARYERHSTAPGQNADQNVVGMTISYRNR
ncbi:MAG: hypothetical protein HOP03_12225 [Lysobacter sp.]|nr:hypothetical protein [Lysobacter sp.]